MIWADLRTAEALSTLPAPDAELTRLYAHVIGGEAVWLSRMSDGGKYADPWPEIDLPAIRALAEQNHVQLRALAVKLADGGYGETSFDYRTVKGDPFRNTYAEVLHHLATHGMYHRGQIALGVRKLGGTPLSTDLIVFMREGG